MNHEKTEKTGSFDLRDMALCGLFAALLGICAWITVPLGDMPFTLQTFGVFMALGTLGGKRGTMSILVYLLLGAVGLPVFSGFRGGVGVLAGATGGYIFGFLATGLVYGLLVWLLGDKAWVRLLSMALGLLLCYALGTAWFLLFCFPADGAPAMTFSLALAKCVIPFLLPDGIKLTLAWTLSGRLKKLVLRNYF